MTAYDISILTLAFWLEITLKEALDLVEGKFEVTLAIAEKLSEHVGGSVPFWIRREFHYRGMIQELAEIENT